MSHFCHDTLKPMRTTLWVDFLFFVSLGQKLWVLINPFSMLFVNKLSVHKNGIETDTPSENA